MSSPKMTRMFGFFAEEGPGDWALPVKTHTNAKLNDAAASFFFMMWRCDRLKPLRSRSGNTNHFVYRTLVLCGKKTPNPPPPGTGSAVGSAQRPTPNVE